LRNSNPTWNLGFCHVLTYGTSGILPRCPHVPEINHEGAADIFLRKLPYDPPNPPIVLVRRKSTLSSSLKTNKTNYFFVNTADENACRRFNLKGYSSCIWKTQQISHNVSSTTIMETFWESQNRSCVNFLVSRAFTNLS
jgi:hypothetical protein